MSLSYFNNEAKKMAELAGWTDEIGKIRCKRGVKKDVKTFGGKTYIHESKNNYQRNKTNLAEKCSD